MELAGSPLTQLNFQSKELDYKQFAAKTVTYHDQLLKEYEKIQNYIFSQVGGATTLGKRKAMNE